jgi:hypothetical protein
LHLDNGFLQEIAHLAVVRRKAVDILLELRKAFAEEQHDSSARLHSYRSNDPITCYSLTLIDLDLDLKLKLKFNL